MILSFLIPNYLSYFGINVLEFVFVKIVKNFMCAKAWRRTLTFGWYEWQDSGRRRTFCDFILLHFTVALCSLPLKKTLIHSFTNQETSDSHQLDQWRRKVSVSVSSRGRRLASAIKGYIWSLWVSAIWVHTAGNSRSRPESRPEPGYCRESAAPQTSCDRTQRDASAQLGATPSSGAKPARGVCGFRV